jgi:hypothetical protein
MLWFSAAAAAADSKSSNVFQRDKPRPRGACEVTTHEAITPRVIKRIMQKSARAHLKALTRPA